MFKYIIDNEVELRLLDTYHSEEIFKSIISSREHLIRYLPWVEKTRTVEDTLDFIKNSKKQYAEGKGFDAGIWYKDEFAGVIGFHSINKITREISIGYWLNENFLGKGIMAKSCKVFIDFAFNVYGLNRVEIRCAKSNKKSRAIPERLGFIQEGIIRDGELLNEGREDLIIYGILKREWRR